MNNDLKIGLKAWQANTDLQSVFNEPKAINYMCAYLCKSEESWSYAMKQALLKKIKRIVMNK